MNAIINWVGALGVARQCVLAVGLLAAIVIGYTVYAAFYNAFHAGDEDDDFFDDYWED